MPAGNLSDTPEVDSAEQQLQQVTLADDESDAASTSDIYERNDLIEKWAPTIDAICDTTRKSFPDSPQGPSATDNFRQYWHGVFTQLLEAVAQDESIPYHLTSPPVNKFIVKLFDKQHPGGCPCCLPDVDPSITLENEQGVSKTDLVRGVRDYLYGEAAPRIYGDEDDDDGGMLAMETALVYNASWMSGGRTEAGERVSYYEDEPEVFMYCCRASEFKVPAREEEEDTKAEKEGRDNEKQKEQAKL
jgi:hypothetical protein